MAKAAGMKLSNVKETKASSGVSGCSCGNFSVLPSCERRRCGRPGRHKVATSGRIR
jgi:hypothetical protein